jgi:hypothetical protein
MQKKQKLLVSGFTVASLLMGASAVKASTFKMDAAPGKSIVKDHDGQSSDEKKEEEKKKKEEGQCGEGSCKKSLY